MSASNVSCGLIAQQDRRGHDLPRLTVAALRHNFGNPRALEMRPDFPIDSMTDLVLGLPGLLGGVLRSQVEWAEALAPTTIIVWIGNNDALNAAIASDTA